VSRRYATRDEVDLRASGVYPDHVQPDAPDGWYDFNHQRWLIFYRSHPEGIEVMRVIDGSHDLPRRFADTIPTKAFLLTTTAAHKRLDKLRFVHAAATRNLPLTR
jgi:hypothetical protein